MEDLRLNDTTRIQAQGYGTVSFIGDNGFKAVINKDKANGLTFVFEYKANITDSGKKLATFYNNYTVDYKVTGEEQVSKSDSVSVKNIDQGMVRKAIYLLRER